MKKPNWRTGLAVVGKEGGVATLNLPTFHPIVKNELWVVKGKGMRASKMNTTEMKQFIDILVTLCPQVKRESMEGAYTSFFQSCIRFGDTEEDARRYTEEYLLKKAGSSKTDCCPSDNTECVPTNKNELQHLTQHQAPERSQRCVLYTLVGCEDASGMY